MKIVRAVAAGIVVALLAGCASSDGLKMPCTQPFPMLSYGPHNDCGPVKPVNKALMVIMGGPQTASTPPG